MAMYDLDVLAYDDVAEYWEEREDCREGGFAVYDEEGNVVDLEAVGQVAYTGTAFVGVCDDDDFVAAVNEFLEEVSRR